MRMDLRQTARLGQQLRLSPRLIQSMEVLQLPLGELEERVDREVESNVALEFEEHRARPNRPPSRRHQGEPDAKMAALANAPERVESMEEQLLRQWSLAEHDERTLRAGRELIAWIGEDGLLTKSPVEIVAARAETEAGPSLSELQETLPLLQEHLEPTGIGARDVRECLLLQLEALAEAGAGLAAESQRIEDAQRIVAEHLADLEANRLPRIAQRTGLDPARVAAARDLLSHLDPAPGRRLVRRVEPGIVPDVVVEYDGDNDRYVAALANGSTPALRVSRRYSHMAQDAGTDDATRAMLREGIRKAEWFIEAIHQRSSTLLRVVEVILARQRAWFDEGQGALRPLPMGEVAAELGVNISTVSRAVAGKYLQTPRGVVDLRRFFTGGTETEEGADLSWDAVKAIVREVIDAEDKRKPLSDEAIAKALAARGVKLARRTVVKYREQMSIPPARIRRQHD